MKLLPALALLPALSAPAAAQMATITPEQIGQIFCIGSLGNDMAPVEALLTPGLAETIAKARGDNAAFEAAHPGDKPPLGDGLPWRSWQDYADHCTVAVVDSTADAATVAITYAFSEAPDATYTDSLRLVPVEIEPGLPPFWRIDDIALVEGQTMRAALKSAFEF